jgi:N-acetylmuramoyl-L-alanine amidase
MNLAIIISLHRGKPNAIVAFENGMAGAGRPFFVASNFKRRLSSGRFGILLHVTNLPADPDSNTRGGKFGGMKLVFFLLATTLTGGAQVPAQSPPVANTPSPPSGAQSGGQTNAAPQSSAPVSQSPISRPGLNIVVLDPAHGGTDTGARGTGGIRESEIVLQFAVQVRRAIEAQGFQVVQTRLGNENPSFDDRSALANAQTGAVFVTLHVASTGLPGTVRVYVNSNLPGAREANGLVPWDRAQSPFLSLSQKLGDFVQGNLAQKFKGSPGTAQASAVRQLRTTAAPAIAVEISSVVIADRQDLDRMAPGVADAIARGVAAFRPSYVVAGMSGASR